MVLKSISMTMLVFMLSSFFLLSSHLYFCLSFNFFSVFVESLTQFKISLNFTFLSYIFLAMLLTVSCLVFSYSQSYMSLYNNIKFSMLTLFFFFSMLILTTSYSFFNLMFGWDMLGLTSLCLIMFYPVNNGIYNSFLTMFFNRLGDVMLLYCFSVFLHFQGLFLYFDFVSLFSVSLLIFICTFTKSATFPFSSWLPAAMSAPTPISAMVHSSTLVTAGIFVLMFFFEFLNNCVFFFILSYFSLVTFLAGGVLCNLSSDYKKIIAFSTMSQISMMLFFFSISMFLLTCSHMLIHALFKTLLFCAGGSIFVWNMANQRASRVSLSKLSLVPMLVFSCYSMGGIFFSSSFYSKDVALEILILNFNSFFFLFLLVGSVVTGFYISKLLSPVCKNFIFNSVKISTFKNYSSVYFCVFSLTIGMIFNKIFLQESLCFLHFLDVLLISFLVLLPVFLSNIGLLKNLVFFSMTLIFMKKFSFTYLSLALESYMFLFFHDTSFFRPANFLNSMKKDQYLKFSFLMIFGFSILLMLFFF